MKQKSFEELTKGIASFEDVVARRGDKVEDIIPHAEPKTVRHEINNANTRVDYVAEYLRQGSTRNFYYPVFDRNASTPSGFGFLDSVYAYWRTLTHCGSRLWQPTGEHSRFLAELLIKDFELLLKTHY